MAAEKPVSREFLVTITPADAVNAEDIYELIRSVTISGVTVIEVRRVEALILETVGETVDR